uniref:Zmm29 n=1 Tax=Arundo donax TaxID=35708 RepID=A0A0A9FQB8_ARUDO
MAASPLLLTHLPLPNGPILTSTSTGTTKFQTTSAVQREEARTWCADSVLL